MKDFYPPTDVSPHGPFPEGTSFVKDEIKALYLAIPGQGLYKVKHGKLEPTDKNLREGYNDNFFHTGTELDVQDYLELLAKQ